MHTTIFSLILRCHRQVPSFLILTGAIHGTYRHTTGPSPGTAGFSTGLEGTAQGVLLLEPLGQPTDEPLACTAGGLNEAEGRAGDILE